MIRALWLFIGLALVVSTAGWLADRPGNIAVDWQGWRIETSVAAGAVAYVLLLVAGALAYRGWLWLRRSPRTISQARRDSRRYRGEIALFRGMTALAAGEEDAALKFGHQAETLLDQSPLPLMLSAQAAQQAGNTSEATRLYNLMLKQSDTEFLGVRGLLVQALRADDTQASLRYARRAQALRPGSPWAQNLLFDLQSAAGLWSEAYATLEDASRRKVFDKSISRRRKALTVFVQAQEANDAGELEKAAELAWDAHTLAPDFVPGALLAARHFQAAGKLSKAARAIEACWRGSPHPELAALYLTLYPGDDPARRVRRITRLDRLNSGHREGHAALAGVLAAARRWHEAHAHLDKALAEREEPHLLCLKAQVEEGEHGSGAAGSWLQKVSTAQLNDMWVCAGCGTAASVWGPHCGQCGSFDLLAWGPPVLAPGAAVVTPAAEAGKGGLSATLVR